MCQLEAMSKQRKLLAYSSHPKLSRNYLKLQKGCNCDIITVLNKAYLEFGDQAIE